ncbi:MAG: RAD52 family DNA repair protein [Synechococcus sp.]
MTTTIPLSGPAAALPASRPARTSSRSRTGSTLELLRDSLREEAAPGPAQESQASSPEARCPQSQNLQETSSNSGFTSQQIAALSAPLDRAHVRQREQGRSRVSYLEGWQVIAEANRIFGFDGWQRQTLALRCVGERERPIGRERRDGWSVTYTARVRITVGSPTGWQLIREGSGAGHGIDADLGLAHESALKEAETDAMKRALMTFGNPFGLALYDKQQRQVSTAAPPPSNRPAAMEPKQPAAVSVDAHLEPATIAALQQQIKALSPARLEAFSRGFRSEFQVPDSQPSLAGLITTNRHRSWIETFLAGMAPA